MSDSLVPFRHVRLGGGLLAAIFFMGIVTFAVPRVSAADMWEVRDLGVLPGDVFSTATSISNRGQVSGFSSDSFGKSTGFRWEDGTMTPLKPLPGLVHSVSLRVNDAGDSVGGSWYLQDFRGTLWRGTEPILLPPLPGETYGAPFDLNASGSIVGFSAYNLSSAHAVLWEDGVPIQLGGLGGPYDAASGINEVGQIVGSSTYANLTGHAVLWEGGQIRDLGTLPGDANSGASRINDAGQVAGTSFDALSGAEAFLWENGEMTPLGFLPGERASLAFDINATGAVVGYGLDNNSMPTAILWQDGGMTALPALAGKGGAALGINDAGLVVGWSEDAQGIRRAVLWSRVASTHDVAVADATDSSGYALVGAPVTINATIQNQGTVTETFDVEAYANANRVGTVRITDLAAGASEDVSFRWDTTGTAPGSYDLEVRAAPVAGETDTADNMAVAGTVIVYRSLGAAVHAPSATDVGVAIDLTCSGSDGVLPYTYTWDLGDGTKPSGPTVRHAYETAGTKAVVCTVTDEVGNKAESQASIVVHSAPSVTAQVDHMAASPGVVLHFSASGDGGSGGYTYQWTFGDGQPADTARASHAYAAPGEYAAKVTMTDSVGGTASKSFTIKIATLVVTPHASASSATTGRDAISFTAQATGGSGEGYTFTWDFGDSSPTATGESVSHVYGRAGSYTPTVTVQDSLGNSTTLTLSVIRVQDPSVSILGEPIFAFGIIAIIVAAAVVAAAAYLARRTRPRP